MADTKISDLASGAPAQATDEFVAARAGSNVKLTFADLTTVPEINMPGSVDANDVLTIEAGDHTADRTLSLTASAAGVTANLDSGQLVVTDTIRADKLQLAPAGTSNASGFEDSGSGTIYCRLNDAASSAGIVAEFGRVGNEGRLQVASTTQIGFVAANVGAGNADTALARVSAGVMRVSNGSTGLGYLTSGVSVTPNTGTATPGITDSGKLYTNTGDGDGSQITLPNDPTIGTVFEAYAVENQAITIVPSAGESIRDGASTGSTSLVSATQGAWVRLVAVTGGAGAVWGVCGKIGTWNLT